MYITLGLEGHIIALNGVMGLSLFLFLMEFLFGQEMLTIMDVFGASLEDGPIVSFSFGGLLD